MKTIEGNLTAAGLRIALVASRFNSFLVEQLVKGATDAFARMGGADGDLVLVRVPGAYEIPVVAKKLAASGAFRAMCDRMPEGALHEAVEATDAVGLVGAFASELGRERHAEKPAAPSREPDAPRMTR